MPPDAAHRPLSLLAVTGLSPQVVTETIWAIARRTPRRLPSRITLLTTEDGANAASRGLPSAMIALGCELGQDLPAARIQVMHDARGAPLRDIATDADNECAANAVVAAVARETGDPQSDLHVSIAGGRKTMGCLAALAISLFGRAGDSLSHVLVNPRLQGRDDFYFPPSQPALLPAPGGGTVDTVEHGISLVDIPFVRLRGQWHPPHGTTGFAAAVAAVQGALEAPRMTIDTIRGIALLGDVEMHLPPALLGTLLWFAERARAGAPAVAWSTDAEGAVLAKALQSAMRKVTPTRDIDALERALRLGLDKAYLAEKVSRLNRAIRHAIGPLADAYAIRTEGRRPRTGYRLGLDPAAISIVEACS